MSPVAAYGLLCAIVMGILFGKLTWIFVDEWIRPSDGTDRKPLW